MADKKYTIAGKEFTLRFGNYALREHVRDFEKLSPTWFLYRDETREFLKIVLEGDVESLTIEDLNDEKIIAEIQEDFFGQLKAAVKTFSSYSKN